MTSITRYKLYWPLLCGVLAIGVLTGVLFEGFLRPQPVSNPITEASENSKNFFSDEYIITSDFNSQTDIFLKITLNRKQTNAGYIHYYSLAGYVNGNEVSDYADKTLTSNDVAQVGFLRSYTTQQFPDLGSRQYIRFSVAISGTEYHIDIPQIDDGFVVHNTKGYVKLVGEGKGTVQVAKENDRLHVARFSILSHDYTTNIFFPGSDTLESHTDFLTAWSSSGEFLVLDTSTVAQANPYYTPHTWFLSKDSQGNYSKSYDVGFTKSDAHFRVGTKGNNPKEYIFEGPIKIGKKTHTSLIQSKKYRGLLEVEDYGTRE